ncbi:MerR family DNA-binding transcriptional regulator [Sphingomonas bisphenolicum]|uniref:MerR family DNA-binding transcriptional regulator n=1 Tax=Sphingomonas bisphenolicum TaxID=296544 RepID=UPI0036F3CF87
MRELEERTGVHRETIRVYLREGLIPEPARPAKPSPTMVRNMCRRSWRCGGCSAKTG